MNTSHFQLTTITTKDNLIHQGLFFQPSGSCKVGLLWVHGLTSNFYSHVCTLELFYQRCKDNQFAFAAFNNRGHDIVSSIQKIDPDSPKGYSRSPGGASQEIFEDCVNDIEAGVQLILQGCDEVVLIGHSTGANKVVYYLSQQPNPRVSGAVLASPLSDRLVPEETAKFPKKSVKKAQTLIKKKQGDTLRTDLFYYPMTPNRLISLLTPRSNEDVFDYGDPKPTMKRYSQINRPLLVIFGEKDEHADRPITEIKKVFDLKQKSSRYRSVVVPDGLHGFGGKERELVSEVISWVKSLE